LFDPLAPSSWWRVARRVQALAPDGALFQYWMPYFAPGYGAVAALLRRWTRAPTILLAHNLMPHEHQPGEYLLTRWLIQRFDSFIVQSATVRDDLLRLKPNARYAQVPHPVHHLFDCSVAQADARTVLGVPACVSLLLFFGYVRAYKGLELLLEALARIARSGAPSSAHLLVVGEFYVERQRYEQQIAALGLTNAVTLIDRFVPHEQVGLYFAAADLIVLPYLRATQSGIVPIAYAHERPVIVTAVGGLPEQVVDGATGYVVPPDDPDALAQAIVRFFTQADRPAMTARIRQERQRATWTRLAEAIESLL
jgi:glycosyltransferase involved in cell wall biosynthesis